VEPEPQSAAHAFLPTMPSARPSLRWYELETTALCVRAEEAVNGDLEFGLHDVHVRHERAGPQEG
jgi:hypothetical protein